VKEDHLSTHEQPVLAERRRDLDQRTPRLRLPADEWREPDDRESAQLTKKERASLDRLRRTHELSALARASLDLLVKG